jgi:IPT/TIG domain
MAQQQTPAKQDQKQDQKQGMLGPDEVIKQQREREKERHAQAKEMQGAREKDNNPNTAKYRQYNEADMPGMHPFNQPDPDSRERKGTRLDLEDITGNPGHRGINPDAPATSINPPDREAGGSINEPAGVDQNERQASTRGTAPLAGQGSHASINEPYGSTIGSNMPAEGEGEDDAPELLDIDPDVAAIGDPDVTLNCHGEGFTADSVIVFNGGDEPTTFLSPTHLTTIVKPSTAGTPGEYGVTVRNAQGESEPLNFEFVEAARASERKAKPKKPARESKKKKRK